MQSFELKFLGVTILQGVEFPIFLLIFEWALQQCSATALPVITVQRLTKVSNVAESSKRSDVALLHIFSQCEKKFPTFRGGGVEPVTIPLP